MYENKFAIFEVLYCIVQKQIATSIHLTTIYSLGNGNQIMVWILMTTEKYIV